MNDSLIIDRRLNGGSQKVYRFPNGYGASLIEGGFMAYGGREIAVVKFDGDSENFSLCYDTPITDGVLGHLSEADAERILSEIAALPTTA